MREADYEVVNEFLPCVCGCLEHHAYIELVYWKKNQIVEDCDLTLSLHIAPQSFWKRIKNAFKYVFQLCKKNGEYDKVILNKTRAEKFKILIDKYLEYVSDNEVKSIA